MRPIPTRFPAVLALLALAPFALADNHKWEINEVFSSVDGKVQFVELFDQDKDEEFLSFVNLSTASGGFFAFPNDLPSSNTENRHVLIATAAFAAIPGAPTPDYIIPAGFLQPLGDTVTYSGTPDSVTFGALPVDGVRSMSRTGVAITNSPTNFAGQTGSIRLAISAQRNGSGVNPMCYTSIPPALGKQWTGTLDVSGHPGATTVVTLGHRLPGSGLFFVPGELLVDPFSPLIFKRFLGVTGVQNTFKANVPVTPSLIGFSMATQGVIIGGGYTELCNAVDMTVGW